MRSHIESLGSRLRLHVKTAKSLEVTKLVQGDTPGPIAVSTLKEAEEFAAHGFSDILYGVAFAPAKLGRALALARSGVDLKIVLDSPEAAQALTVALKLDDPELKVLIEIDCDGHRSGLRPGDPQIVAIARINTLLPAVALLRQLEEQNLERTTPCLHRDRCRLLRRSRPCSAIVRWLPGQRAL